MKTSDLLADPIEQFLVWMQEARAKSGLEFPEAAALATEGPSVRMVLVKKVNEKGFYFFTNYESRKAEQLKKNARAALCFYWESLGCQVRVEGRVEKASPEESDEYFHSRPRGSQIGAWSSPQSRVIPSRQELEALVADTEKRFPREVPRPENWGGYRIAPERIEFWKNGQNRLHNRVEYHFDGSWKKRLLAP